MRIAILLLALVSIIDMLKFSFRLFTPLPTPVGQLALLCLFFQGSALFILLYSLFRPISERTKRAILVTGLVVALLPHAALPFVEGLRQEAEQKEKYRFESVIFDKYLTWEKKVEERTASHTPFTCDEVSALLDFMTNDATFTNSFENAAEVLDTALRNHLIDPDATCSGNMPVYREYYQKYISHYEKQGRIPYPEYLTISYILLKHSKQGLGSSLR